MDFAISPELAQKKADGKTIGLELGNNVIARDHTGDFCMDSWQLAAQKGVLGINCLLYTSPSPRDLSTSRMPSSA